MKIIKCWKKIKIKIWGRKEKLKRKIKVKNLKNKCFQKKNRRNTNIEKKYYWT